MLIYGKKILKMSKNGSALNERIFYINELDPRFL
jgi:hypothetical protein